MAWRKATKPSHDASLHGAGWNSLHTHSAEHIFVSLLQDGGELRSTGAVAAVMSVIFPKG